MQQQFNAQFQKFFKGSHGCFITALKLKNQAIKKSIKGSYNVTEEAYRDLKTEQLRASGKKIQVIQEVEHDEEENDNEKLDNMLFFIKGMTISNIRRKVYQKMYKKRHNNDDQTQSISITDSNGSSYQDDLSMLKKNSNFSFM